MVRRIAGLGTAPGALTRNISNRTFTQISLLLGRPLRITAPLEAAADAECRVLLIDEQEEPGGALLANPSEADIQWLRDTLERIAAQKNITR